MRDRNELRGLEGGRTLSDFQESLRPEVPYRRHQTSSPGDLEGSVSAFRFGQFYKGKNYGDDGPIDLFQNTCVVRSQEEVTSFQFYRHSPPLGPPLPPGQRRSFNNIFVDVEPAPSEHSREGHRISSHVRARLVADSTGTAISGSVHFRG